MCGPTVYDDYGADATCHSPWSFDPINFLFNKCPLITHWMSQQGQAVFKLPEWLLSISVLFLLWTSSGPWTTLQVALV